MSALKSKDARLKLHRKMAKAGKAGDIFWESIGKGRSIGFRWLEGSATGRWYARLYDKNRAGSPYHRHAIGTADDVGTANGEDILDFNQALTKASSFDPWGHDEGDKVATVADACRVYLVWAESNRPKSFPTIKSCLNCHVLNDEIATIPVSRLSIRHLERWKSRLAQKPRGHIRGNLEAAASEDELRSRKSTANISVAWLKASLSYCKKHGAITVDDAPWRLLEPFKGVTRSGRRGQAKYLSEKQLAQLLDAIDDPNFLNLVKGAVYLGARYSELSSMRVGDWNPDNATVTVVSGKGDKKRNIFLGDSATHLFSRLCAGRSDNELIFLKANGTAWGRNHQQKPLQRAIEAAGIQPRISFHGLRSSYASHYLMSGGDIFGLATQLGHSDTVMLSKHYGHLANQHRQQQAKAHEPQVLGAGRLMGGTRDERLH
jgi:integrase|tara:strand:+ start:5136 stop:6431 length:1296 start_codon:yes stop_codon:yes gene_type:complete